MYLSFQIPTKYRDYPLILVSDDGHIGAALESTPDGREGWGHYAPSHNIPTFVVDQSDHERSSFDARVIHECVGKLPDNDPTNDEEGKRMIPAFLMAGVDTWTFCYGHLVNPLTGQPTGPRARPVLMSMNWCRTTGTWWTHRRPRCMNRAWDRSSQSTPRARPSFRRCLARTPSGQHHRRPGRVLQTRLLPATEPQWRVDTAPRYL